MHLTPLLALSPVVVTLGTVVALPVLVAALTAIATLLIAKVSSSVDRRREHYSDAIKTLVAWIEFPYRVRRRPDDAPATLTSLSERGHDLQELLSYHEAWITTENRQLAEAYTQARMVITSAVGPAIREAWETEPATKASDMNLNGWGPSIECNQAVRDLQLAVEHRFRSRWKRRKPKTTSSETLVKAENVDRVSA